MGSPKTRSHTNVASLSWTQLPGVHTLAATALRLIGKNVDALTEAQKERNQESRLVELACAYWALGRRTESDAALQALTTGFADTGAYDIGAVHGYRADADCALTWLERAYKAA